MKLVFPVEKLLFRIVGSLFRVTGVYTQLLQMPPLADPENIRYQLAKEKPTKGKLCWEERLDPRPCPVLRFAFGVTLA